MLVTESSYLAQNNHRSFSLINSLQPSGTSGRCLISEAAQYTLIMDSAGMMVERKVSSDSCDANGTCTVSFTQLNQICNINISASNSFGSSEVASAEISKVIAITN